MINLASVRARLSTAVRRRLRDRRRKRAATKSTSRGRMAAGLTASLLVLLAVFGWSLAYLYNVHPAGRAIGLSEVQALADQGRLQGVTFYDQDDVLVATYTALPKKLLPKVAASSSKAKTAVGTGGTTSRSGGSSRTAAAAPVPIDPRLPRTSPVNEHGQSGVVHASIPSSGQAFSALTLTFGSDGIPYRVVQQSAKKIVSSIATFLLPLMVLANLFALLFTATRAGGSAIGEVMTFGTIGKGKAGKGLIGFADVGGADEAVAELREVRDYLTDPGRYEALGAAPPKGVLLFGAPGTGKTLLAKAVAGEAGVPFFSVAGAEFVESLVGVGAARVRDLFARVRAAAPAIVFIDELDAAGRKRGTGAGTGGSDEREQTLNQLLVEMDGFEVSSGIVVIGATNRPDILDPALMRPGRFDRHITIERPDHEGREHILRIHARGKPLDSEVDLELVARRTPGFTGADLANVVNEATLLAIRGERRTVLMGDLEEAIERVLSGPKRRGRVLDPEEVRRVAFHEAGHAIVSALTGHAEEVHRLSILGRGRTLGTTELLSDTEALVQSRAQLVGRLSALMGGVAAERLVFGDGSTGSEQDIASATDLARDIVARYGLSDRLGPVRLLAPSGSGFLGEDTPLADVSGVTQAAIDEEIHRLLADALADATARLHRHRGKLDALAGRLVTEETLDGESLLAALAELLVVPPAGSPPALNGSATRPARKRAAPVR